MCESLCNLCECIGVDDCAEQIDRRPARQTGTSVKKSTTTPVAHRPSKSYNPSKGDAEYSRTDGPGRMPTTKTGGTITRRTNVAPVRRRIGGGAPSGNADPSYGGGRANALPPVQAGVSSGLHGLVGIQGIKTMTKRGGGGR